MVAKPRPASLACTIAALLAWRLRRLARAQAAAQDSRGCTGGGNGVGRQRPCHGQVPHGRQRQPAGDRGWPGDPAAGRQCRRRRHRRPAGAQSGRAAVLGARRRRLYPALGRGACAAERLRRARDGAGGRHGRPVSDRGPAARFRRGRVWWPQRRRARHPRVLEAVHQPHGRLPWARLFAPAIRLAADGFRVSPRLHLLLRWQGADSFAPAARRYFFDATGSARPAGYLLRNPQLAATLRASPSVDPKRSTKGRSPRRSSRPCARPPTTKAT